MSTQQDIYAAGSESRPPMLNKENYVPWSCRLLRYAKSRPNGKLIHNSILNGPYVKKMIPEPGDANREITVTEIFHLQTDDELSDKELKQIEVDDQSIQTILLGLPEDIYAVVDSCETAQEIWLRVQQMMKGELMESYYHRFLKLMNDLKRNKHFPEKISSNLKFLNNLQPEWSRHVTIVHQTKDLHIADYTQLYDFLKYNQNEVDELKAERLAKTQDPLALMANSNNPYAFPAPHQDQSSFNQNYLQQPMLNPEDITDPTTAMNMALALMAKAFKLNYSTPTNNNQRISSNPRNRQIAQPGMNMGQDRQMQMVGVTLTETFHLQIDDELTDKELKQIEDDDQANQTILLGLPEDIYVAVDSCEITQEIWLRVQQIMKASDIGIQEKKAKNAAGQNENQIRCYNCNGVGHYARNCTEVNASFILMANLQQASTSGTRTDNAPVYDSDGSAEVHENCDDNEIFNMFTQEEQYTELLEPIPESHQVPQNDNDVISEDTSVEQETLQLAQESHNKMKQIKEIKPANYTKINHLSGVFVPQKALSREELYFLNNSKTANVSKSFLIPNDDLPDDTTPSVARKFLNEVKSTIVTLQRVVKQRMTIETHNWSSSAHQELHKIVRDENFPIVNQVDARLQNFKIQFLKEAAKFVGDFKSLTNEADASLTKHKALELEIERLLKVVVSQDIMIIVQNEYVVDTLDLQTKLEQETLQLAQESRDKMKQMNKEIKPANYTKINHLLGVFVPQKALSPEELYFSNNSKTVNVSKSFLIPNEDLSDDTTPSVACKFLNEVKSTILTLQRVVKQRMTLKTHNWSSSAHQELHKIIRDEIFPIINQVDARLQNFEIQFLKEAAKFVGDFKSLANEADASLAKHKALELEIESLLKAVVSQDIMIIVQNESVVDTSDLQTELERTKERFEKCIIKKETKYAKLWNDWVQNFEIQFLKEAAKFVIDFKSLAKEADSSLAKH
nr:hypothetical protein [Tanacetum cinerariifolium]